MRMLRFAFISGVGLSRGSATRVIVLALTVLGDGWRARALAAQCSGSWSSIFGAPGMNNEVRALVVFDDGSGPALYAGGLFTTAGGVSASRIAKWNGVTWSALGTGMNGNVFALAVFDDGSGLALYAGGLFTTAGGAPASNIAKWNGAAWSALGSGVNSTLIALTVFNDGGGPALYAAGNFTTAGGSPANRVAKWNGTTWSALGSGIGSAGDSVQALAVFNDGGGDELYAGGIFTTAGGGSANHIAKWNGSAWSALGSGMGSFVRTLTATNNQQLGSFLYVGGDFATAGGVSALRMAKWDGSTWSAVGSGMGSNVLALTVMDDGSGAGLYAGGNFTTAGGGSANRVGKWNGSAWSSLGSGVNLGPRALIGFDDGSGTSLYTGGAFTTAGGVTSNFIAEWQPSCTVFVDAAAIGGGNNGSSWTNAYRRLRDALAEAAGNPNVDEIWVANGTYKPTDKGCVVNSQCPGGTCNGGTLTCLWSQPREQTFQLLNGLGIYGGFHGNVYTCVGGPTPGMSCSIDSECNGGVCLLTAPGETNKDQRDPVVNVTTLTGDVNANDDPETQSTCCVEHTGPGCDDSACETEVCSMSPSCCMAPSGWDIGCVDLAEAFCSCPNSTFADNSLHVVSASNVSESAVLDGFGVVSGRAREGGGGGIDVDDASPTILNCRIMDNRGRYGGGMSVDGDDSNPIIRNCLFHGNTGAPGIFGGGLNAQGGLGGNPGGPQIVNCVFRSNTWNGAHFQRCSPTVVNSVFTSNAGGGVTIQGGGSPPTMPQFIGCLFDKNTVLGSGSPNNPLYSLNASPTLINCTIADNDALAGVLIQNQAGTTTLRNCIVWGNNSSPTLGAYGAGATFDVSYSDIEGGFAGTWNSDVDPQFRDPVGGDYSLQGISPAIDAANTPALPADTYDLDDDGNTTEYIALDVAGNPRILDDLFTPDTGVPGSGVVDMGAYEYIGDCNGNGIPDECDVNCGPIFGSCEMFDCETVADCITHNCCQTGHGPGCSDPNIEACVCNGNPFCCQKDWDAGCADAVTESCGGCGGNGIPDECEIAACDGDPACGDCNHNDVPDECDIASATSLDVDPADGAPDECDGFVGFCTPPNSDKWSCPGNWFVLPPGTYPDDVDSAGGVFVELDDSDNVFFDVDATIPALDMLAGTTLRITQTGTEGDLDFSAPAEMEIRGTILIAGGRTIGAGGIAPDVIVGENGWYRKDASSTTSTTATLYANNVTILGGVPGNPGGKIELTSQMSLITGGNLVLESGVGPFPNVAGITPPPKLRLSRLTRAVVAGAIEFDVDVEVTVTSDTAATDAVSVSGDFVNRDVKPSRFDWSEGALAMTGPDPQEFEVAGMDIGNNPEGFQTDRDALNDTAPHSNFTIGTLQIGTDSTSGHVTFVNRHVNTVGTDPCDEALYVRRLIVKPGSTITLDNCRVYYGKIEPNDGSVVPTVLGPCGPMLPVDLPSAPNPDPLGKPRTLTLTVPVSNTSGPGTMTALRVRMIDLQHPKPANVAANTPKDFTAFDLTENGVCTGGSHAGHHCDEDADCRLCASGSGIGMACVSDADCRRCSNDISIVCSSPANCVSVGGNCGAGGLCSAFGGTCSNVTECSAANETEISGCIAGNECGNCARWVGKTEMFLESQDSPLLGSYKAARLQCTPLYHDWSSEGQIHVVGAEILPSSIYHVERFAVECAGNEVTCAAVSDAVVMATRRSGDVVSTFNPSSATTQPDATDVTQLVNKFKNVAGAPVKAIALIQPNLPEHNADLSASDIVQCVDAVKSFEYPFGGPCPCPSLAACGALACPGGASVCVASALPGLGPEATCIKTCRGGTNHGDPCLNNNHCSGGGICDKECLAGTNAGQACISSADCPNPPGANAACAVVVNTGFCRDRCGRCTP